MYNIVVLCSGILYTLSKFNNSSFNLIARNAVQVMIILYSQFYNPSCNLCSNKNKYLYCFFIDFKKFVKLLSLSTASCSTFPHDTVSSYQMYAIRAADYLLLHKYMVLDYI